MHGETGTEAACSSWGRTSYIWYALAIIFLIIAIILLIWSWVCNNDCDDEKDSCKKRDGWGRWGCAAGAFFLVIVFGVLTIAQQGYEL